MSHAVQGHPRWPGHSGEFWQNMVHCKRGWQITPIFLPWKPHEQSENIKRYDTRWAPQLGRCSVYYKGGVKKTCTRLSEFHFHLVVVCAKHCFGSFNLHNNLLRHGYPRGLVDFYLYAMQLQCWLMAVRKKGKETLFSWQSPMTQP